jgi:DNA invertase Pin-like site-specific DNA recombinase
MERPGLRALIEVARAGKIDLVLTEGLDRLSRDQEDIAGLYKRLTAWQVGMVTLSEGRVSELHIGLKGTMNALFLKDLAAKSLRGQSACRARRRRQEIARTRGNVIGPSGVNRCRT